MATIDAHAAARARRATPSRALAVPALLAVFAVSAALRFGNFASVYTTPYYDAAVRSMALSWHNFFYGALEPSGQISIDKTPVDLWLQVASTELFGFSSVSLRLPAAIAGTLGLLLLFDLVRRGYGRWAGLAAALALAVLPSTVLTSRSDTMDTVMATLLIAAAWLVVRARPERRGRAVIAAGAVAGLAFEVKLFEAAVALPALALLAWLALDAPAPRKARTLGLAGLAFLGMASSWAVVASLLPGHHPYPLGSTDGQIWNVILVYNGLDRLGNAPTSATAPGLLRLFEPGPPRHFGELIGVELITALTFGALAVVCAGRSWATNSPMDDRQRRRLAVGCGLGAWLVLGAVVASFMGRQWPRYLEAFTPAVAGVLGIAIVSIGRAAVRELRASMALCACSVAAALAGPLTGGGGVAATIAIAAALGALILAAASGPLPGRDRVAASATALIVVAALTVPAATSLRLVRTGAGDSEGDGQLPAAVLNPLSAYLRAHQGTARYEVASASILKAASLILRDARPVLTLAGDAGRPLVTPGELAELSRTGQVRYALIGPVTCNSEGQGSGCAAVVQWVRSHGTDVSRAAGLPRRGTLYRLPKRDTGVAARATTAGGAAVGPASAPARRGPRAYGHRLASRSDGVDGGAHAG
jgi:4-amino-4-deoxy-L-arabinose transferase-like glycosyltransferase